METVQSRKERSEAAQKTQQGDDAGNSAALPERFVALTFDDVHLKIEDALSLRVAAGKFLDAVAPGDRVGIFSTSGQLAQDFTSDKEMLKQKLLGLVPRGMLNKSTTICQTRRAHPALCLSGIPSNDSEPGSVATCGTREPGKHRH